MITQPSTISGINRLPYHQKREIYARLIPPKLLQRFNLSTYLIDPSGNDLLHLQCRPGSASAELELYHKAGFPDPVLYGHVTDTINGQVHILLYMLSDPDSPRFDVDRMPDGTSTQLGTNCRNIQAEIKALEAGLAPGQIRGGLGMLGQAIQRFEYFVVELGHDLYFAEPLYYHTAILFERYGFHYEKGRSLMARIHQGFTPDGELYVKLDGSNAFRQPEAAESIRLRSWAIQDGLLGEPFTHVTMYKRVGQSAGITSAPNCNW